ncbi:hypothetical protein WME91_44985 [Sorangium sp. So ce269]
MYEYSCDWKSGFVMDPLKKQRVGYLVMFSGLQGLTLAKDLKVFTPYAEDSIGYSAVTSSAVGTSTMKAVEVVGVLENFSWGGGVGDPIALSGYISQENAKQLQVKQQTTLKGTGISALAWWIVNYDEENKQWFEEAHPIDTAGIKAQLNAPGGKDVRLAVANEPVKIAPNIDVNVFNLYFEVVPAANSTYDFHFATSSKMKFVKGWGLKVGTQAEAGIK